MYPNNNNKNNKRIKTKKKEVKTGEGEREERGFFLFFFLCFSLRSTEIECRFSSEKAKSVHVSRATCGHQNLSVSSNSKKYRIFLLVLFLS